MSNSRKHTRAWESRIEDASILRRPLVRGAVPLCAMAAPSADPPILREGYLEKQVMSCCCLELRVSVCQLALAWHTVPCGYSFMRVGGWRAGGRVVPLPLPRLAAALRDPHCPVRAALRTPAPAPLCVRPCGRGDGPCRSLASWHTLAVALSLCLAMSVRSTHYTLLHSCLAVPRGQTGLALLCAPSIRGFDTGIPCIVPSPPHLPPSHALPSHPHVCFCGRAHAAVRSLLGWRCVPSHLRQHEGHDVAVCVGVCSSPPFLRFVWCVCLGERGGQGTGTCVVCAKWL